SRAPVGYLAIAQNELSTNQGFRNLIIKTGFLPEFIYYLFLDNIDYLKQHASGSTFQELSASTLKNMEFLLPEYAVQKGIVGILGNLDDKIELLREQNKTLEAIAQAIYKRWFVDFEFPDAKGNPYKSSGGKMVKSELGEIPEGWRVGRITNLINIFSGFAFSSLDFFKNGKYKLVTIKNVQDRHFNQVTKDKLINIPKKMPSYCKLQTGDILLSLTGNIGRICFVIGENYLLNQRVAKLKPINLNDYAFSYLLFLQESIFSILQNISSETAQQNLSTVLTKEIKIIIPSRYLLDCFGNIANPIIQKINLNNIQTQTLSALRDSLIPKLMSGKIRVSVIYSPTSSEKHAFLAGEDGVADTDSAALGLPPSLPGRGKQWPR
ncbi:MAG: restriction endonuclease subunit S, partial [Deltaproteobacteria bacterium]|nr:restriction endonuclease subunit S [Deltaproteobacteria bacterium]